jgi:hypothetical protein
MDAKEQAVHNAVSLAVSAITPPLTASHHYPDALARHILAELGEQGYVIAPVAGPLAWRDATSGTPLVTPHEREVNEVIEAGRTLLRHGADSGNVRDAVLDTFDTIGLAPADFETVTEAVFQSW